MTVEKPSWLIVLTFVTVTLILLHRPTSTFSVYSFTVKKKGREGVWVSCTPLLPASQLTSFHLLRI